MPKRRPIRWLARTLAISAALGVVATVLGAWVSVLIEPHHATVFHRGFFGTPWIEPVPDAWPDPNGETYNTAHAFDPSVPPPRRMRTRQGMHNGVSVSAGVTSFMGDNPSRVVDVYRVGWPVHTMTHRGPDDARPPPSSAVARVFVRGVAAPSAHGTRRYPLKPIAGPFVAASASWGAGVFALLAAGSGLARWRRLQRQRGARCAACGYELGALTRCPECGESA